MKKVQKVNLVIKGGEKISLKTDQHWLENDKQLSLKFLQFKDSKDGSADKISLAEQVELEIFDPNTRTTETVNVPLTATESGSKLLKAVCAQDYISRFENDDPLTEQVSIDFNVLSKKTAMFGRMQLTEEQQEAIAAGK